MDKRTFLKVSALTVTGLALNPFYGCVKTEPSGEPEGRTDDFTLPALGFAFNALEPHIDARTMEIHHGKHHAGYVRKLNAAVKDTKFATMHLPEIMAQVTEDDAGVRNNGGGHFNHSLFWNVLGQGKGGEPTGELAKAMTSAFGTFDAFKEEFSKAAKTRFGSGWAWLSVDDAGKLFISSTPNQDNPLMANIVEQKGTPILGVDVWEHAYYLNYQNRRGDYVASFFNIIDWEKVAANLTSILQ